MTYVDDDLNIEESTESETVEETPVEESLAEEETESEFSGKDRLIAKVFGADDESIEEFEKREKEEEEAEIEANLKKEEDKKAKEEKFLQSLDPVVRVKLETGFTEGEKNYLIGRSKETGKPLGEIIKDEGVRELIQYQRSKNVKPIPNVLKPIDEGEYLSTAQWLKRYNQIIK